MSTIKDVAKIAGVSPSTVSGVINGNIKVKSETQSKIMEAIKVTGYRTNAIARGLRTKETKTLGLILPSITNPYYPALSRGVEDYASLKGYHVFLCNSDRNMAKQKNYIKALIDKHVDGLIFVNSEVDEEDISILIKNKIAVVLNEPTHIDQVDEVWIDYEKSSKEMTEYLLSLGHRRISLINGPSHLKRCKERLNGFIAAHREANLTVDLSLVKNGDFSSECSYKFINELLELDEPPSCVFTTDFMALGVLNAAFDRGLKIPEDLSVAGFDNVVSSRPRLTTIDHPSYDMGKTMVKLAISRCCAKGPLKKRSIMMNTKLIIRDSTRKF